MTGRKVFDRIYTCDTELQVLAKQSNTGKIEYAALAQSVERRLGKAEVGGSSPLGSSDKNPWNSKGSLFHICRKTIVLPIQTPVIRRRLAKAASKPPTNTVN